MNDHESYKGDWWSLAIFLILFAATLIFLGARLATPSDATRLWLDRGNTTDAPAITPIDTDSSLILADDEVVTINGQPVGELLRLAFRETAADWEIGDTVTYHVMREGHLQTIPVTLVTYPFGDLLLDDYDDTIAPILIAFFIGLIFLDLQRNWRMAQISFVALSVLVLFSVTFLLGMDLPAIVANPWLWVGYRVLTFVQLMVISAAALTFSWNLCNFDTHKVIWPGLRLSLAFWRWLTLKSWRRWLWYCILYPIPLLLIGHALIATDVDWLQWMRWWDILQWIGIIVVYLFPTVMFLILAYFTNRDPDVRFAVSITLGIVIVGVSLGFGPSIFEGQTIISWRQLPTLAGLVAINFLPIIANKDFHSDTNPEPRLNRVLDKLLSTDIRRTMFTVGIILLAGWFTQGDFIFIGIAIVLLQTIIYSRIQQPRTDVQETVTSTGTTMNEQGKWEDPVTELDEQHVEFNAGTHDTDANRNTR